MKKIIIALMVLCLSFPVLAQSKKELKYEVYSLKKQVTEIQALKAELEALKEENQNLKAEIKSLNFSNKSNVSSSSESSGEKIINTDEVQPNVKGQCQATTQAGTQCKRLASEGSQYCWQHQGSNTKQKSSGSTYKSSTGSTYKSSSSGSSSGAGRTIQTGSRGGKYYINKNGNKTYIKR